MHCQSNVFELVPSCFEGIKIFYCLFLYIGVMVFLLNYYANHSTTLQEIYIKSLRSFIKFHID